MTKRDERGGLTCRSLCAMATWRGGANPARTRTLRSWRGPQTTAREKKSQMPRSYDFGRSAATQRGPSEWGRLTCRQARKRRGLNVERFVQGSASCAARPQSAERSVGGQRAPTQDGLGPDGPLDADTWMMDWDDSPPPSAELHPVVRAVAPLAPHRRCPTSCTRPAGGRSGCSMRPSTKQTMGTASNLANMQPPQSATSTQP